MAFMEINLQNIAYEVVNQAISFQRIQGALKGAVVGDALGVPYEFKAPEAIPPWEQIEMGVPAGFKKSYPNVPLGTWSDDTALMLALFDSLLSVQPFSMDDFSQRMLNWYFNGEYTPDGHVFDVGPQTQTALLAIKDGIAVTEAAPSSEYANGCGSLMRVLPVAFFNLPANNLIQLAIDQSTPTHPHIRSGLCCGLYVVLVNRLLNGMEPVPALEYAISSAKHFVDAANPRHRDHYTSELNRILNHRKKLRLGSGYVVDTFWSAWEAFSKTSNFESCLKTVIQFGHDTDSTACVAGGFAGAYYGLAVIPDRWSRAVVAMDTIDGYLGRFEGDSRSKTLDPYRAAPIDDEKSDLPVTASSLSRLKQFVFGE